MINTTKSPEKKSFWKTFLEKARKVLTVLFALGIDKHLDYDQEETGLQEHKSEKKKNN